MAFLRSFLAKLNYEVLYFAGYVITHLQSLRQWWRTRGLRDEIRCETGWDGRPVLLLALYRKGVLRPDTIALLEAARARGMYTVGVNTLRLGPDEPVAALFDCYIERPNFGRDFGSYRAGFLHLGARGVLAECPRLLMMNDSVYVASDRIGAFLRDMLESPLDVVGATENYEVEYHLGSFCIALSGRILRQREFLRFWQDYRLTDVRPRVIRRGEMALSRLLKRLVPAPEQLGALYGAGRFAEAVARDDSLRDFALNNGRTSALTHWKRVTPERVLGLLQTRLELELAIRSGPELATILTLDRYDSHRGSDEPSPWRDALRDLAKQADLDPDMIRRIRASLLAEIFMEGSQIHQNAATLLRMGLPLVKLDGLYRGMFNMFDVGTICTELPDHEARALRALLMERPWGADTYVGWKRAAFLRGLI